MRSRAVLGDVLLGIEAGKSIQTAEVLARPDELGVLKVSAVTWSDFRADEAKALKSEHIPSEAHKVRRGDLLISRANTKEFVGAIVLVNRDYPLRLLSDKTLRLIIDETRACKEYLVFALRAPEARKHIEHFAAGTSDSMRNISQEHIRTIPIALPPAEAQRSLAGYLRAQFDEVELASRAIENQLKESQALMTAIYRDAFREIVPIGVPPIVPESPNGWRWHKIAEVARLESGHTPSRLRPDWWGGDISWISLTEIRALDGRWVDSTQLRTNAAGIENSAARILPRGTVCLSRTASVGFVTIMGRPMATSQDFANWVCSDALDPEYLMYALIRSRSSLRELATGATHKTIYMPTLEALQVCAPNITEQRRIVAALKRQLAEVHAVQKALKIEKTELAALPQRIYSKAFEN